MSRIKNHHQKKYVDYNNYKKIDYLCGVAYDFQLQI
jgi:hypothetical protein